MITALEKINQQALQEIKDYSTGKKYFVSDFQEKVRKRNIKAKKKLTGYANAGALSGAGPMEEVRDKLHGGKGDDKPDSDYDLKQLAIGIKHESEHTDDKNIAKEIAKDHLSEDPNYYKKIAKIEEGIFDWLGLTREQEKELYSDYSQPIEDIPLWIGAFPLKHMEEVRRSKKFDVIILMANDVVELAQRFQAQKYQQYKNEGFIIDEYAIQDVETDPGGEDQKIKEAGALALKLIAPQNDNDEPKKVLITCAQGLNRSAAATCLTLQSLGITPQDAYQAIQTSRTAKKQALEMIKAQQSQTRPRKLGNQAFMLHGVPHARFLKLVGINPETISLQERIRKLVAQVLKESYNR